MNKQSLYNANNLQRIGSQMYYFEIDANPIDPPIPVESEPTIPLNVLVNAQNNHFLVVKPKNQENSVCVYVEPTVEDNTLLNYINNQRFPVDGNSDSIHNQINPEPSTSAPEDMNESQVILIKTSDHKTAQDFNIESYINLLKNGASEDHLNREKASQIKGFVHISDRVVPPRAIAVLPPTLHLRRGSVIPRRSLPQRVRFGPVQGISQAISFADGHYMVQNASTSKTPIFLLKDSNGVTHIDVSDKDKCNWIGLLPLGNENTANVWLYEEEGKLYGITIKSLAAGTPLALGYSKSYAQEHSIPHGQPIMDICKDFQEDQGRWWCYECLRAYTKLSLLERHINQCHTDDIALLRRKYRCRHCTRTFGRLSTLKRHIARYCNNKSKKTEKPDEHKKIPTEEPLNITLNIEDNRLPSDESLQNYTNGLDFSTSLFDTDRMPGFDISGSSRSETEFNPYGISYRYDHELTSGTGFEKLSSELNKSQSSFSEQTKEQARTEMKQTKEQTHIIEQTSTIVETKDQTQNESLLISCPYCKQTILREKKREHLSGCTERRLECECGRTFSSKEQLAKHIHAEHSNSNQEKTVIEGTTQPNTLEYRCETCQCLFKRRGMLVNHLWRKHKSSAVVPLERRVRHYPCAACPKVYRTAAKRNRHQSVHHPDVSASTVSARYAIEGGLRCVAPAACAACPRQYATRAKLLQHVRQTHPDLAPPKQLSKGRSASQNNPTKSAT